ncbi:isr1p [Saccharomyces arboricola H-6]|uniref:non-specific serine/threonine protein kinase n=1 Tax=Saccharomyces arboricola (strain H-6 / AS 2.3317 / CBS 10644) TaxID=1160507 RepID=J8LGU4_SACAR|nr:isr1p [Saccharomyces arboricola H-6]
MNSTPPTSPFTEVHDGVFPSIDRNSKNFVYHQPQKRNAGAAYSHLVSPVEEPATKFNEAFRTEYPIKECGTLSETYLKNDLNMLFANPRFYSVDNLASMFHLCRTVSPLEYLNEFLMGILLAPQMDFLSNPDYTLPSSRPIGQGSYSYVYTISSTTTSTLNNDLSLVLKFAKSQHKSKVILQEALTLAYLQYVSPSTSDSHIIPFYGLTYINKSHFRRLRSNECVPGLILPKCRMNLYNFNSTVSHELSLIGKREIWWKLLKEMLDALKTLKINGIIHGDIKTANILITETPSVNEGHFDNFDFYLADFTSAFHTSQLPTDLNTTVEYCAPELIDNSTDHIPTFKTDLYAVGLCLLSFISQHEPYNELQSLVSHGSSPGTGSSSIQRSQWLINVLLKKDPINLNILRSNLFQDWKLELAVLSKILVERLPLEELLALLEQDYI